MLVRVQRKRTKGWKMPPNTVYVGRGSKCGNQESRLSDYCPHCGQRLLPPEGEKE